MREPCRRGLKSRGVVQCSLNHIDNARSCDVTIGATCRAHRANELDGPPYTSVREWTDQSISAPIPAVTRDVAATVPKGAFPMETDERAVPNWVAVTFDLQTRVRKELFVADAKPIGP